MTAQVKCCKKSRAAWWRRARKSKRKSRQAGMPQFEKDSWERGEGERPEEGRWTIACKDKGTCLMCAGREPRDSGWDMHTELLFLNSQKLLNDKKTPEKSTAPSETKNQHCQEPFKEEEYEKLRDLLKQRDNEISILCQGPRHCAYPGCRGEMRAVVCVGQGHTLEHPTLLPPQSASMCWGVEHSFTKVQKTATMKGKVYF